MAERVGSAPAIGSGNGRELVDGLVQLSFVVQSVLGRLAEQHGLSTQSLRMLAVLDDREIGMQQLAGILELEKSSVTGLVDRAERRGLVRRRPAPGDRRAVRVTVTDTGHALVQAGRERIDAEFTSLLDALSEDQRVRLRRSVFALIDRYVDTHDIPL